MLCPILVEQRVTRKMIFALKAPASCVHLDFSNSNDLATTDGVPFPKEVVEKPRIQVPCENTGSVAGEVSTISLVKIIFSKEGLPRNNKTNAEGITEGFQTPVDAQGPAVALPRTVLTRNYTNYHKAAGL